MIRYITLALVFIVAFASLTSATLYQEDAIVYDDVLDITWLLDANYIVTSGYASANRRISNTGAVTWDQAQTWVNSLTLNSATAWRLPTDSETTLGYGSYGELGTMYYDYLGNVANDTSFSATAENPDDDSVTFLNVQRQGYWTGTQSDFGTQYKWIFNFSNGAADIIEKRAARAVWPVHDGDLRTSQTFVATWQGEALTWQGESVVW